MNKKLKKMLAAVSAVTICASSVISTCSSALYICLNETVTPYTVSFNIGDVKYGVWQEMNDYFDYSEFKFFISEDGLKDVFLCNGHISLWGWNGYTFDNEEDATILKEYLTDNDIEYKESSCPVSYDELTSTWEKGINIKPVSTIFTNKDEYFQFIKKVKEDTGFIQELVFPEDSIYLNVTDIVNELPEPTLSGDADCDGKVNINDAVFVMQSIANPDKYQLSWQGKANADIDGNGITLSDAIAIQEMAASHLYG